MSRDHEAPKNRERMVARLLENAERPMFFSFRFLRHDTFFFVPLGCVMGSFVRGGRDSTLFRPHTGADFCARYLIGKSGYRTPPLFFPILRSILYLRLPVLVLSCSPAMALACVRAPPHTPRMLTPLSESRLSQWARPFRHFKQGNEVTPTPFSWLCLLTAGQPSHEGIRVKNTNKDQKKETFWHSQGANFFISRSYDHLSP